jgi:hypothetical protein
MTMVVLVVVVMKSKTNAIGLLIPAICVYKQLKLHGNKNFLRFRTNIIPTRTSMIYQTDSVAIATVMVQTVQGQRNIFFGRSPRLLFSEYQ